MAEIDFLEFGRKFALLFIPFLFSLCVHEYAHGLVAKWKGDNTADMMGRLTLNPMAHADILGTFILPLLAIAMPASLLFGWAKPVPVNPRNLSKPREDMFWIALAGPLSNLILAMVGAVMFALAVAFLAGHQYFEAIQELAYGFVGLNLLLAWFNMIPFPPLDGGKVVARFLPYRANAALERMEPYGIFVIFGVIVLGGGPILFAPVYYASNYLFALSHYAGLMLGS